MSSYILEIFCSSKYPLSSVNFFCFSHLKKKRSHIKNFSDGFERFILGLQFDKIAPNEYNSTKIDTKFAIHTQRKRKIRWLSNYSPAKISNNNSSNLYESFDNHPIKNRFRFLDCDITKQCERLAFRRLPRKFATFFFSYGYTWKVISPEDRPKGVASNLSVYRVSDYHISSIKCFCDRGNYYTV